MDKRKMIEIMLLVKQLELELNIINRKMKVALINV